MDDADVDSLRQRLKKQAGEGGYHLNPDEAFTDGLVRGILTNAQRYGYGSCPCRLASGTKGDDLDIICPCDYRDADLNDFGACYCALYVSAEIAKGDVQAHAIPERRPPKSARDLKGDYENVGELRIGALKLPVWRCRVCGYLCAREEPPAECPICFAAKERFERFI